MDTFVPPGWISRTELVGQAGKILFGNGWAGPLPTPLEILQDQERRALDLTPAERTLAQRLAAAELLKDLRAREPERVKMHDRAVAEVRQALCTSELASGLKDQFGEIFLLPAHVWGGNFAFDAFDDGEATYQQAVRYRNYPRPLLRDVASGMVLFKRDDAEAWLARLEAQLADGGALAKKPPTADDLFEYLDANVNCTKTEPEWRAAAADHFKAKLTDRLWRKAWGRVSPEKKLKRGARPER